MKNPYLILRLCKPHGPIPDPPASAKGYYLKEGKQEPDPERSRFISAALNCDYMGSAEFEFGAVPKAFREMAKLGKQGLETSEVRFTGRAVGYGTSQAGQVEPQEVTAWVLALKGSFSELEPILKELASTDFGHTFRTKEIPYVREGLFGKLEPEYRKKKPILKESRFIAWFDLDNLWFLTKSKEQLAALNWLLGLD